MKKIFIHILKFSVPLGLGILLIWYIYKDLSAEDKNHIADAFRNANYWWILLSVFIGVLSHISRAYRWLILLNHMGYQPRLSNSFFSVMIGYIANLAFPRLGEVSRCAVMGKYEKIPFEKLFGTVLAERIIDMIMLFLITLFTILFQLTLLGNFLNEEVIIPLQAKFAGDNSGISLKTIVILSLTGLIIITFFLFKSKMKNIYTKVREMMLGFAEGLRTVFAIKRKGAFIFHTLLIWALYFLMLYVCFFSLEETKNVSLWGVLSAFVFGSFGIIAVQGGIGAYPAIVTKTLMLFGIAKTIGFAFGWIAWTGQFVMILVFGVISLIFLPITNKKVDQDEQA